MATHTIDRLVDANGDEFVFSDPDVSNKLDKNGDGSDVTVGFTEATNRTNIDTGRKLSTLFGQIRKWFADLKALAFKDKVGTSDVESGTYPIDINGNAATATTATTAERADIASATSSGIIGAKSDLNNYNANNRNYLCNANNASSVSNKPSGASGAFELEVIRGTGSTCVQVYYSRDDVSFNYIRKYTGSKSWTSWEMMMSQDVSNKLNVDGSNATTDGVVAMMKKAPLNSTIDVPADTEYYYSDGSDKSIVRRSIRNVWNYIKSKLGSAGSSEIPIYIENGVPKSCASVMPVSVIDSGDGIGYGVYLGGNSAVGSRTRCYCAFLLTATASPDWVAHTYIGTFTFRHGSVLNYELKCLTGTPKYPMRIAVSYNKNSDSTYNLGVYVIPADPKVNTYANYKLTRIASAAFTWACTAINAADCAALDNDGAKPALVPQRLYFDGGGSNVVTTGGSWLPTFDKGTINKCRGIVDLSVQVDMSVINQTTYVETLATYTITLVNSAGTDILSESLHQKGRMPRQTKSSTSGGTVDISNTHRFVFPITESCNLFAGYRPKITLSTNYPLDSKAQVSVSAICSGIVLPYYGKDTSF